MILVNISAAYTNQVLTVALKGNAKALTGGVYHNVISIIGALNDYKGKPEIVVSDRANVI